MGSILNPVAGCAAIFLAISAVAWGQRPDTADWRLVRGDNSPGFRYSAFVETAGGRLVAAGGGGALMTSDDGGNTWEYSIIEENGRPFFGTITDLERDGNGVVGIATALVPSNNVYGLPFEGRTKLLTSGDGGRNWSISPFPFREAFAGRDYEGLALTGLHRAPDGSLLAYGTTQLSSGVVTWSIGGAVFRKSGGGWNQATFQRGRLSSMATANSRLVAAGFQTVLDSADGGGWNGYSFLAADFRDGASSLPFDIVKRLDASDVVYQNGEYIMQAQTYVPLPGYPRIFTATIDHSYTFRSTDPFGPARRWEGSEHARVYPNLLSVGSSLVSILGGAYRSTNGGQSWSTADASVFVSTPSYGRVGAQSVVAIGSSEDVWRSDDAGSTWSKVLDLDDGPDLRTPFRAGSKLYAFAPGAKVWRSSDNGVTWEQILDIHAMTGSFSTPGYVGVNGGEVLIAQGDALLASADDGANWTMREVPSSGTLGRLIVGHGGRLVFVIRDSGPLANGVLVHTSENNGQTWQTNFVETDARIVRAEYGDFGSAVRAGGNRIVYLAEGFKRVNDVFISVPNLFVSDDNGSTWRVEDPFSELDGLEDLDDDFPGVKTSELVQIKRSTSGRLIIRGDDELLTSDDRGDTWAVRVNQNLRNLRGQEQNLHWEILDLTQTGSRWIAIGGRDESPSNRTDIETALVSEDDGSTWREVIIDTQQVNTGLFYVETGLDGRVIATGSNAAVYVLDVDGTPDAQPPAQRVREGETLMLEVPRPPVPGDIELTYTSSAIEADEIDDFVPAQGTLTWDKGDNSTQQIAVDTVDDDDREDPERFALDLQVDGDVTVSFTYEVLIDDDDGTGRAGLDVIGRDSLVVDENGSQAVVGFALLKEPTADVNVVLTNRDPDEISVAPLMLTYTPSNWKRAQHVTVTGLDDQVADLDRTASIDVEVSSADADYEELQPPAIGVVNLDNDQLIFADGFES